MTNSITNESAVANDAGPGGLIVLMVDCFDQTTSPGGKASKAFGDLVKNLVGKNARITRRKMDDLIDYTLDFEHTILVESSKTIVKKFDKIDLVLIAGDLKEMPWSPRAYQLITLLRMCHFTKKAVFACGGGAFHSMFCLATQGRHFHILNAPNGDLLERLATFPRYAQGTQKHAVGWLDNETGDIYEYQPPTKTWRPICNVGFYRVPASGTPALSKNFPPEKVHGRSLRMQSAQHPVEAMEDKEDVLQIRNQALHHWALRKLPTPSFVMTIAQNWYFNIDGALPSTGCSSSPLAVLAEGRRGPVLMAYDGTLLLGCEIEGNGVGSANNLRYVRRLMKNFLKETVQLLKANSIAINQSLFLMLFGAGGEGGGTFNVGLHRPMMAPPLATSIISSSLGAGPKKILVSTIDTAPAIIAAMQPPPKFHDDVDNEALTSPRIHKTTGKKIRLAQRTPEAARMKRLDLFLQAQHHPELGGVAHEAMRAPRVAGTRSAPNAALSDPPNSSRGLFGDNLAYLDGPRKVGFKEEEEALLLGNAGGMKWRPNTAGIKRSLTAPIDKSLLRPMRPASAGPMSQCAQRYNSSTGKVVMSSGGHERDACVREPTRGASNAPPSASAPEQAWELPPISWAAAMEKCNLYDVYINAPPRIGSREQAQISSMGQKDTYSALADAMKDDFLPAKHPVPPREQIVELTADTARKAAKKKPDEKTAAAVPAHEPVRSSLARIRNMEQAGLHRNNSHGSLEQLQRPSETAIMKVVVISGKDAAKPFNTYSKFEKLAEQNIDATLNEQGEYVGLYKDIYRSALEQGIYDYNQSKKGFIGGPFKNFSGIASALPLRKEGQVRPMGPYPTAPPPGLGDVVASDWNMGFLQKDTAPKLAGLWRK